MTKIGVVRIVTPSLVILGIVSGVAVGEFGYGGLCSLGVRQIWATCPLGFLERSLASRELLPQWPSVALVVLSVILLGRVFCAWVCPTVVLRRVWRGNGGLISRREAALKKTTWATHSPYAVLGGVLLASFLFRFPVFCFLGLHRLVGSATLDRYDSPVFRGSSGAYPQYLVVADCHPPGAPHNSALSLFLLPGRPLLWFSFRCAATPVPCRAAPGAGALPGNARA